ncbi:MAG TPA: beta-propeller domain-containing protein, partial [Verrucomicrobiae bacterium]
FFPGFDDPVYLVVGGIDLADPRATLDVNAFLGAGDQVYCSTNNLYVTASRPADIFFANGLTLTAASAVNGAVGFASGANQTAAGSVTSPTVMPSYREQTDIYKIALGNGRSQFLAANTVKGSVLDSYSMDEHDGYIRVATTEHAWWASDNQDHNHLFVLDSALQPAGKLDDFAPGEQIYASRFLGDRAFFVTFQQIDPLFAVDLSSPTNPAIVGQLTLPGYNTFLLPYDANHLIGFGKDVLVADAGTNLDEYGDVPWWNGMAFYQGMKLALFDVTDLHNPQQISEVSIGDRGTDSDALYDPHALLFDASRNLLAFPISVAQIANPDPTQPWQWGDTIFQGAYVYQVSPANGFTFVGSITHKPAGQDVYATWGDEINRILLIGANLYTLSDTLLKVNDLATLNELAELPLSQPPQIMYPLLNAGALLPMSGRH